MFWSQPRPLICKQGIVDVTLLFNLWELEGGGGGGESLFFNVMQGKYISFLFFFLQMFPIGRNDTQLLDKKLWEVRWPHG